MSTPNVVNDPRSERRFYVVLAVLGVAAVFVTGMGVGGGIYEAQTDRWLCEQTFIPQTITWRTTCGWE